MIWEDLESADRLDLRRKWASRYQLTPWSVHVQPLRKDKEGVYLCSACSRYHNGTIEKPSNPQLLSGFDRFRGFRLSTAVGTMFESLLFATLAEPAFLRPA